MADTATETGIPLTGMEMLRDRIDGVRGALSETGGLPATIRDPAPGAETETPEGETPTTETPEGETSVEGAETPTTEGAEGAEGAEGSDEDDLTVRLPGRQAGESVEIVAADAEIARTLRQLANSAMRREEYNRRVEQVERLQGELSYIDTYINTDPVGFILQHIPPSTQQDVARALLAKDGVLEAMQDVIGKWTENPDARRADRAEQERDVAARTGKVNDRFDARQGERTVARTTEFVIDELAAVVTNERQRSAFINDAIRDVEDLVRRQAEKRQPVRRISPAQIVDIISYRLEQIGVKPEDAKAVFDEANPRPLTRVRPVGERAKKIAAQAETARATGKNFVRAAEARRTAAATPTAGAGAVTTGRPTPPAGQGFKDRMKWARETLLGKRS